MPAILKRLGLITQDVKIRKWSGKYNCIQTAGVVVIIMLYALLFPAGIFQTINYQRKKDFPILDRVRTSLAICIAVTEFLTLLLMCITLYLVVKTAKLSENRIHADWKVISLHIACMAGLTFCWGVEAYEAYLAIWTNCHGL